MIGLALLTILMSLWLSRRVRLRGSLGRTESAIVRTAAPVIVGLGGWRLGMLIVQVAVPDVPLTNPVLAAVSIGLPIGLTVHTAWVHRDWPTRTKATGLSTAAVTAVVGAWLGYHAIDGLPATLTSIIGAAAGANLGLIILNLTTQWSGRATVTTTAPSSRPTPGRRPGTASPTAGSSPVGPAS
jgi:hypothetical protein